MSILALSEVQDPSEAGFVQAAEKEVEMLMTVITTRGCKEDLVPDPELLNEGKVLPSLHSH